MQTRDWLNEAVMIKQWMVDIRRRIHQNPELGMQEWETSRLIADLLGELGVGFRQGVANTGVIGYINRGKRPCVALRADMDALPIEDRKDVPYKSQVPGKMHACGHDGHVAMLLGAAKLLRQHEADLIGEVRLLFQPAEEGPGGAEPMIAEGAMEGVDAVFGLHLFTDLDAGKVSVKPGPSSAAADAFGFIIEGKGGHGAAPHMGVDAIAVAAQVITALQTVVSREVDPVDPVVITLGTIKGGYRENVIADTVEVRGTVRTTSEKTRAEMPERIERIIAGVTCAMRASYKLMFVPGYPPLVNDEGMSQLVMTTAIEMLGPDNVELARVPTMGAEDFSYFLKHAPGCFFRLGGGIPDKRYPGHHPMYDFDEDAMPYGSALLAAIAWKALQMHS